MAVVSGKSNKDKTDEEIQCYVTMFSDLVLVMSQYMCHRQLEECDSDPPPGRTSNLNLVLKHKIMLVNLA